MLFMTKFEKNGTIFLAIVFIPIILAIYYHTVKDFLDYLSNGAMVEASVTSAQTNHSRRSDDCDINYTYFANGALHAGHDSISGSCPENLKRIQVYYLKDNLEKSVIGFHILGLSIPIFLILSPLFFIGKYRNYHNRKMFCLYTIIIMILFLILVSVVMGFHAFNPISIKDFLSDILSFNFVIFGAISVYTIYASTIKYILYSSGTHKQGVIKQIKDTLNKKNMIISREIFYVYEVDSKEYSGKEKLLEKYSSNLRAGETIDILCHPFKSNLSCIDC